MAHTTGNAHRALAVEGVLAIRSTFLPFVRAIAVATGISLLAFRVRFLTKGGAVAASAVGSAVFAGAGIRGSATLVSYFLTSSLLGRLTQPETFTQQRGNQRDATQVFANGGVPAIIALLQLGDTLHNSPPLQAAYASAVAAAAADTWATEIGGRYGRHPRSIVTGRSVTPGTSGGVTGTGLIAASAGSALVATVASCGMAAQRTTHPLFRRIATASLAGILGCLADSFAGAVFQEAFYCERCDVTTEGSVHDCGIDANHLRGIPGWSNDMTNVLGILVGAAVGFGTTAWLDADAPSNMGSVAFTARTESDHAELRRNGAPL